MSDVGESSADSWRPRASLSYTPKCSSLHEAERYDSVIDSSYTRSSQADWKLRYYQLLDDRVVTDQQLKGTIDSLSEIVSRLESEAITLRADRIQMKKKLNLLEQDNAALLEMRCSSHEALDLRAMLKHERERFNEELIELSGQLEKLKQDFDVMRVKKAKQSGMLKKARYIQLQQAHETFELRMLDKEKEIEVFLTQSLELQNKQLNRLIGIDVSQQLNSPLNSRPSTNRFRVKKQRALTSSKKPSERLLYPKSPRLLTASAKKGKRYDSLQLIAARLEEAITEVKRRLHVYTNLPARHKERTRLRKYPGKPDFTGLTTPVSCKRHID